MAVAEPPTPPDAGRVTLVAYESFPVEGTPINDALAEFTADSGIEVEILIAGDTGTMLSKAALTVRAAFRSPKHRISGWMFES